MRRFHNICISDNYTVHFKYLEISVVNCTSIKLGKNRHDFTLKSNFISSENSRQSRLDAPSTRQLKSWAGHGCPQWAERAAELDTALDTVCGPNGRHYLHSLTAGLFFFCKQTSLPVSFFAKNKRRIEKAKCFKKNESSDLLCKQNTIVLKKHTEPATLMDTSSLGGAFYRHVSFDPIRTISGYKPPSPLTALLTSAGLQGPCIQGTCSLFPDDVIASGAKSLFGGVFFDFLLFPSWTQEAAQARLASPAR